RWDCGPAGRLAPSRRARVRDPRRRRRNRRGVRGFRRRHAGSALASGYANGHDRRGGEYRAPLPAPPGGGGAAGDDRLYQRHDGQAQGRGDDACEHRRAGDEPRHRLGVAGGRLDPAGPAAAPRARNHQRAHLRAVGRRALRDASEVRRGAGLGPDRRRRPHPLHGGAHHLREADHRLGGRRARAPSRLVGGLRPAWDAAHGLGLRGAAGAAPRAVARDHRPRPARALRDGWFRTGDVAVSEHGAYRMLGRSSVDIIKTGGYKVSALEVEEVLRTHPAIAECAVVGVDDPEWGERICAAVERRGEAELTLAELQAWAKERLAPYKIPRALRSVPALPRNALGKVTKPEVAKLFTG